jgi:hypothetical protein
MEHDMQHEPHVHSCEASTTKNYHLLLNHMSQRSNVVYHNGVVDLGWGACWNLIQGRGGRHGYGRDAIVAEG